MGLFDKIKKRKDTNLDRYMDGYQKTRKGFGAKLGSLFRKYPELSDDFYENLTEILLESDVGPRLAMDIIDSLRKNKNLKTTQDVKESLIEYMASIYNKEPVKPIHYCLNGITVILVVGVNGVGKTTSIAKLAKMYKKEGKKVAVVAADTFRAGAREQLQLWANRLEITCIAGKEKEDPSSVIVQGCQYAKENDIDILLCDTAGRLQNKNHLMQELAKMYRVINKIIPGQPMECWLVLDATTGQNGLSQANVFKDISEVTGIILTKMDGLSKGGIILAIKDALNIPVRFIGTGETADDIAPFDLEDYLSSILEGIENE